MIALAASSMLIRRMDPLSIPLPRWFVFMLPLLIVNDLLLCDCHVILKQLGMIDRFRLTCHGPLRAGLILHPAPLPIRIPQAGNRKPIALGAVARPAYQDAVGDVVRAAVGLRRDMVKFHKWLFQFAAAAGAGDEGDAFCSPLKVRQDGLHLSVR